MRMFFSPQDGMEVICRGDVTVYEPRGNYQMLVKEIIPKGEGALQIAFERLKKKLYEEGLFDESRKKTLPFFPEKIGVVTSPTGAAIQDMISVMRRRLPSIQIILVPVQVQGAGAAQQISDAIDLFNEYGNLDLIIVGRGGGSIEDLWAFNEEIVARAIARSNIPIVSAVGHEIDFTICDFVADVRAATPSAAAEIVTPRADDLLETLSNFSYTCFNTVNTLITKLYQDLRHTTERRAFYRTEDLILNYSQRLDDFSHSSWMMLSHKLEMLDSQSSFLHRQVNAFNPDHLLKKGFAIPRKDGVVIRSTKELTKSDTIDLTLHDGQISATVNEVIKNK